MQGASCTARLCLVHAAIEKKEKKRVKHLRSVGHLPSNLGPAVVLNSVPVRIHVVTYIVGNGLIHERTRKKKEE